MQNSDMTAFGTILVAGPTLTQTYLNYIHQGAATYINVPLAVFGVVCWVVGMYVLVKQASKLTDTTITEDESATEKTVTE